MDVIKDAEQKSLAVESESGIRVAKRDGIRLFRIGLDEIEQVKQLNTSIFGEDRIINTLDRADLLILLAVDENQPVGFKVGYRENRFTFYSAKGGVIADYRRKGVARFMLDEMCVRAREMGYKNLAYDTFPNRHPGMTVMGLREGFRVTRADYNPIYKDFRIRFERKL